MGTIRSGWISCHDQTIMMRAPVCILRMIKGDEEKNDSWKKTKRVIGQQETNGCRTKKMRICKQDKVQITRKGIVRSH